MNKLTVFLILGTATMADAGTTRLAGMVRNTSGQPIEGLTIHFYQRSGPAFNHLTATTAPSGKWSLELPPGEWRGAAKTDDVLARGYFCVPGFIWCGETGELCDDQWPPLWGGGIIDWNPVNDPVDVTLILVPTRPDLTVEKPRTTAAGVSVSFETTDQEMTVVRQWRIEKSTDLTTWSEMQTVALSGSSPVIVPDPASASTPVCYYRAVQVEDLVR
jgi:hypothetical protein